MKREYIAPEMEVYKFTLSVAAELTSSVPDNSETLGEEVETMPDVPVKPKPFS